MKYALLAMAAVMFSTPAWSQTCDLSSKARGDNMPTPIETVTAFSAAFPEDHGKAAIRRWFIPKTVWVNEGVSTTTGVEEAIAFIDRPARSQPSILTYWLSQRTEIACSPSECSALFALMAARSPQRTDGHI
ncbi:hypothetical protein FHW96_004848 [Novosphingobium sp. SG751A]|uniref:limonene-1,2-epoxide hydrolase family protein n=1 Tax=Novosphingobium sp. SG751A TaxID=2587000 RepID=UPI0020A691FA|nr:limonene-1,2-epoxide hydrolase family protein [Novosphingobium sp. SG751A]NOW48658.1 hypothetical protein [Novosphingobium sp. SG751A]